MQHGSEDFLLQLLDALDPDDMRRDECSRRRRNPGVENPPGRALTRQIVVEL